MGWRHGIGRDREGSERHPVEDRLATTEPPNRRTGSSRATMRVAVSEGQRTTTSRIHLRPGALACLAGVLVGVVLFWAFQPRNCVGVPDGPGMDPSGFTKECDTRVGVHLSLPYNSDPSEHPG